MVDVLTPADVQRLLDRRRLTVLDDVGRGDQIEPWPWGEPTHCARINWDE